MDEIERMYRVALRAEVVFKRPLLNQLLAQINIEDEFIGIVEDIDPMQVPLEQINQMEQALQSLLNFRKPNANFSGN